ncbi:MAG TPA: hypothetical protein VMM12_12505 [Longimicrobiales bacterium]|nr:hypothetical protein [Longimicrobiales bacterium]
MTWPRTGPLVALLAGVALACGGRQQDDTPAPPPPPPDLTGALILLLPSQGDPRFDSELAFWLAERAPRTTWILPDRMRAVVDRSPGWRVQLDALPPGFTEVGDRRRVTGGLYDHLRRLGAVLDARLALVPYPSSAPVADSAGVALELTGVLVDVVGGRVVWHGTVRGGPAPPGAQPSVASAAQALAQALSPL